ncbi:IclR family transcriptional regulator C-terminal domain-containing protein [Micromonospora sp. NPDC047740]|uniref:IclR family transcriptional regulator domain-containing protein n=1 Tax=Micromonospora sp. NPDC047740 TaxID=3364254 RepID=UPI00371369D2
MPNLASGSKAILAALPPNHVRALYEDVDEIDLSKLRRELTLVRKRGFAINDQLTEAGLTAPGVAVRGPSGAPEAAISLAIPTARFDRHQLPTWVAAMTAAATRIENDLAGRS